MMMPTAGDKVRVRVAREARVVSTEVTIPIEPGQVGQVVDVVPEFHEALVSLTSAGPRVWIDWDDLDSASLT